MIYLNSKDSLGASEFSKLYIQFLIYLCEERLIDIKNCLNAFMDIFRTLPKERMEECFDLQSAFLRKYDRKEIHTNKLSILKITNLILQRVSPSLFTKIRGKIQMLLSEIFVVFDKSGVNFKGNYNKTSINSWNNFPYFVNKSDDPSMPKIDENLYNQFWIIQKYLANPILVRYINLFLF